MLEQYQIYKNACYGGIQLAPNQEAEVRQSFFAGALVSFQTMSEISKLPPDVAEEQLAGFEKEIYDENLRRASELQKRAIAEGN